MASRKQEFYMQIKAMLDKQTLKDDAKELQNLLSATPISFDTPEFEENVRKVVQKLSKETMGMLMHGLNESLGLVKFDVEKMIEMPNEDMWREMGRAAAQGFAGAFNQGMSGINEEQFKDILTVVNQISDAVSNISSKGASKAVKSIQEIDEALARQKDSLADIEGALQPQDNAEKADVKKYYESYQKAVNNKSPWEVQYKWLVKFISAYEGYRANAEKPTVKTEWTELYDKRYGANKDRRNMLQNILYRNAGQSLVGYTKEPFALESTLQEIKGILQGGLKVNADNNNSQQPKPKQSTSRHKTKEYTAYRTVTPPNASGRSRQDAMDDFAATYWSTSRDLVESYADVYSKENSIIIGTIKPTNPLIIDAKGVMWDEFDKMPTLQALFPELSKVIEENTTGSTIDGMPVQKYINEQAKQAGFDAVIMKNVQDNFDAWIDGDIPTGTTIAALNDDIVTLSGSLKEITKQDEPGDIKEFSKEQTNIPEYYEHTQSTTEQRIAKLQEQQTLYEQWYRSTVDRLQTDTENNNVIKMLDDQYDSAMNNIRTEIERLSTNTITESESALKRYESTQEETASINIDVGELQAAIDKLTELVNKMPEVVPADNPANETTTAINGTVDVISPAETNQIAQEATLKQILQALQIADADDSNPPEPDTQQNDGQKIRTAIMQELAKYGTLEDALKAGGKRIQFDGSEVHFGSFVSDYLDEFLGQSFNRDIYADLWKEARETFYKFEPVELTKEDAINIIREKVPDNILEGWFRKGDSAYKTQLESITMSDDEIRNAALNIMWSNFKEFSGKDIGFKEFLNSEIPVYRGKNSEKYVDGDELLAFSFDENMAKKFGNHILETLIKPIETLGAFQTTAEAETLVYRKPLEGRAEYQQWHNKMTGIDDGPDPADLEKIERSIKNQNAWIKTLGYYFNDENFHTSGKREATQNLREARTRLAKYVNHPKEYQGEEYAEEKRIVALQKAYDEAKRIGVAQSTLDGGYTPSQQEYERASNALKQEYEFRQKTLQEEQEKLRALTQTAEPATTSVDNLSKKIANIPSEEDIKSGKASWRGMPIQYDANQKAEGSNWTTFMKLGPKFFDLDEDGQRNVLDHEVAHTIADQIMKAAVTEWQSIADIFIPEKESTIDGETKKYREGLYGDLGATALSETVTHALSEYFSNPDALKQRSANAYGYIEKYVTDSGNNLDNAAAIEAKKQAQEGFNAALREEQQIDNSQDNIADTNAEAAAIRQQTQDQEQLNAAIAAEPDVIPDNATTAVAPTNVNEQSETQDMNTLLGAVQAVTEAVKLKTRAFWTEKTAVDQVVAGEIAALGDLETKVNSVQEVIGKIITDLHSSNINFGDIDVATLVNNQRKISQKATDSNVLDSNIETEFSKLSLLYAKLESTGQLTDEIKQRWSALWDDLGNVNDGNALKLWRKELTQVKNDIQEIAIANKDAVANSKSTFAQLTAVTKLYTQMSVAAERADGPELKAFYTDEANKALVEQKLLREQIVLTQEQQAKLDALEEERVRKINEVRAKQADKDAKLQAINEEKEQVQQLLALYEKLGEFEALSGLSNDDEIKRKAEENIKAIEEQIEAHKDLLKLTNETETSRAFERGQQKTERSINAAKQQERQDQIREAERVAKELGKLEAKQAVDSDNQELANAIDQYRNMLSAKQQALDLDEKDLDLVRLRAQAEESIALKMRSANEAKREQQKTFNDELRAARKEANVGRAGSVLTSARDTFFGAASISSDFNDENVAKLKQYHTEMQALQKLYTAMNSAKMISDEDKKNLIQQTSLVKNLTKEIGALVKEYDELSGDNVASLNAFNTGGSVEEQKRQLIEAVKAATNGKAVIGDFDATTMRLNYTLKDGSHEFTNYQAAIRGTNNEMVSIQGTTKRTETLFESMARKTKEVFAYFGGSSLIYEGVNQIRRGIQYVREIDLAMTELKKVTDETEESYDRFLDTASKTADKVGSTISNIVSSTADWARLGYSMEEAAGLAESTSVLLNVSEFSSIEEATSALTSTMQAFGYTASQSMDVVDVMNEVGKTIARR